MSYHLGGVIKKSSYSKTFTIKKILCSVCFCYRLSSLFSTNYCCSNLTKHFKRQICDTCVHQHVLSKLYSCLTNSITCPEMNCLITYSPSTICDILLKYQSYQLLNDYLCEQQWQGKSDEWIKRFAVRCPGCNVPIEKNGGCDEIICIQCQTHFYWSKAKRYCQLNKKYEYQSFVINRPLFNKIFFLISLFLILCIIMYFK